MVNPKKDYEQLMQYLQGAPLKKQPVSVPDPSFKPEWKTTPQANKSTPYRTQPKAGVKHRRILPFGFFAINRRLRILIAAVAICLFVVVCIKAYAFYKLTPDALYAQLYTPYKVRTAETVPQKNTIESYYNAGNFVAATLQSKKQSTLSQKENLLAGLAYLQRNDYSNAIKWLEPVAHNFKNPYRQPAEYYLSLAYLKNGDYDRSIEKMERIYFAPAHPYNSVITKEVIQDLKMLKWK